MVADTGMESGFEPFVVVLLAFAAAAVLFGLLLTVLLVVLVPVAKGAQRRTLATQDFAHAAGLTYVGDAQLRGVGWQGSPVGASTIAPFRTIRDVMFGRSGEWIVVHFRMERRLPAQAFALPLSQWVVTAVYLGGNLPKGELPAQAGRRVWLENGWLMTLGPGSRVTPEVLNGQMATLAAAVRTVGDDARASAGVTFGRDLDPRVVCGELFPTTATSAGPRQH